jgi:hypothetical protein
MEKELELEVPEISAFFEKVVVEKEGGNVEKVV